MCEFDLNWRIKWLLDCDKSVPSILVRVEMEIRAKSELSAGNGI